MAQSTAKYEAIPQSDEVEQVRDDDPAPDPRFEQPTPSPWKRAGLLFLIAFLFWLTYWLRTSYQPPKVLHANRFVS